jgi:hypothetical protein
MRRRAAGILCVFATVLSAPSGAGADTLRSPDAIAGDCTARLATEGADRVAWTAPARGYVTATLRGGRRGDWDLAAFRRGEAVGASTNFASDERVDLWAQGGQRFVFQACRREGGTGRVPFEISFERVGVPAPAEPVTLASVSIAGPEDVAELERMGVDVTHDVDTDSATVVLYSREERERLLDRGFGVSTLIADLAAADAADREREARIAARGASSGLPSGRVEYRQYVDYTNDMQDLVESAPDIVRQVTIGTSLEGRPIQGLEIATDVDATDDGRPVYVNVGAHHAREWPSAEFPMEFAIDLVQSYGTDARVTELLDDVRVLIVPIVNVDGFIASRSYGESVLDDDQIATLPQSAAGSGAYRRKNCRPDASDGPSPLPCHMRTSGVDLNRNYGAYWGGPGSSSDPTSQQYRGPDPYSEPESEAIHQLSQAIHPTVFISNHTFTEDGKWLRQPGFDAPFLPQDSIGATTPDEAAMKALGDDMEAATGWTSERGYETLGDITGATEDWNYFAQGSYGYTPEARGLNFHANYPDSVVEEYVGDPQHAGQGVREGFLVAGERAADPEHHSVIEGSAPEGATLRLHKEFKTPLHPNQGSNAHIDDVLDSTLDVPDDGSYEWHVMPSGRPLHEGETWTMSCELPGEAAVAQQVFVARGDVATVDWGPGCEAGGGPQPATCKGLEATLVGTPGSDRAAARLIGTPGADVIVAGKGNDVVVADAGRDVVCGGSGDDKLKGGPGKDFLGGGRGQDSCPDASDAETRSCRRTGAR